MSDELFIIHLNNPNGKRLLKKADKLEEVVNLLTALNKGSVYLKEHSFMSFEYDESIDDGLYLIKDNDYLHVFKVETITLKGYLYDSVYKNKNVVNRYELIRGNYGQL